MALTDYVDFTNNYLVKNGMIGNATNFNKSIDKLKLEVDELNTTKVQKVSSTDSAIPRFDGTSGDLKNSTVTINDSGVITGSLNGNAGTATALQTARTVQTNLGSTASASFNGSANITPGVTGTLPVGNGGTGATTLTGIVKGNGTGAMTAATAGTDYVIPSGSISGNAGTASALATGRTIGMTGDVTWTSASFNGSANVTGTATLANSGVTAGTYKSVTVDAKGRVTAGTNPTTLIGYGITDAQTASRTSATFTTAANTWYRIATSVVGIERNSAEFVVDWTVGSNHGSTRFAAACHYGESAGVSLMQTNYAKYGTGGITEARIVYHTTFTGNYAYVEVKFAAALTSVVVNVEMQDPLGWTLVTPSTAGSIPSGYSSYVHTFVPSAAITAGTYPKVTINQEGRVISGSAMLATDIPNLDASKITTGTLPVVRGGTGVTTSTGTGSVVLSTSPTLVTPTVSGKMVNNYLSLNREIAVASGIEWYSSTTANAWIDYMGNAGAAGQGPKGNITPSAGTLVTSWARRNYIENAAGYGWTFESGSILSTTPTVVAEIRSSDGAARFGGGVTSPTFTGALSGNANTATTLQTARTIGASGDVTGTATSFNGSANITIPMTLANSGVTAGTYSKVTVDAKGRVTAGLTPTMEDIPDATFKRSVRCATTANITLSGTQTIDGIAVVAGDRVLVKDQTTASQNGIYVVAAGAWTRALDADSSSKISSALVAVDSGTLLGGKLFDNDFKTTDTLGTTAMTWSMNLDDGSLLTAGSTSVGIVKYSGTTAVAGQFDGGATTPTGSTRLNYGGYFYPTYINLTGSADATTASSHIFVETSSDGFVRPKTLANFKTEIFASPTLVTPNIGVATGTSFNSITGLSSTSPLMNGTAAVGTGVTVARADHVHPTDTSRAPLASPAFTGTPTVNGVAFSGYSGFKNYIINGNFDVDQYQRGAQSNWSSNICYTDRFLIYNSSNVVRNGAGDNNPVGTGLYNHLSITKTAGADTQITQRWEIPKDKAKKFLNGRTLTFSCWVLSGTTNIVENLYFIKQGSSANAYETKAFNITKNTAANVWTRITGTITNIQWTYEAGDYIEIRVDPVDGFAGEFHTTGWQLEEGSVATSFENRPIGLELSLCQRYYELLFVKHWAYAGGASQSLGTSSTYKQEKRVVPSVSFSGFHYGNCSGITNESTSTSSVTAYVTSTSAGEISYQGKITASAEL